MKNWTRYLPTSRNKHKATSLGELAEKEHAHPDVSRELKRRAKKRAKRT